LANIQIVLEPTHAVSDKKTIDTVGRRKAGIFSSSLDGVNGYLQVFAELR
jgi:hypothetical protein